MSSYDQVPYTSRAYPRTHPDNLNVVARLAGFRPPAIERVRVLEIGCGSAGNLLPMAATLPNAHFVGLDASEREIARGEELRRAARLENVRLFRSDLSSLPSDLGELDHVIVHGVYSWVAPEVQRRILQTIAAHLAPNGIAYVSFNTLPGFQHRAMFRDMMLHHVRDIAHPMERALAARRFLDLLRELAPREDATYSAAIDEEVERVNGADPSYLFHEHLEAHNEALYLHQFVDRAAAHGLRYVGDAEPAARLDERATPRFVASLRKIAGDGAEGVALEQAMDFVRNRSFRLGLLTRRENAPIEDDDPLAGLYLANAIREVRREGGGFVCVPNVGGPFVVEDAQLARLLERAGKVWPDAIAIGDVLDDGNRRRLSQMILRMYGSVLLELRPRALSLATRDTRRPRATSFARVQAATDDVATNLRHEPIPLDADARRVLATLDGSRERSEIEETSLERLATLAFLLAAEDDQTVRGIVR